jgi:hypothetical protein
MDLVTQESGKNYDSCLVARLKLLFICGLPWGEKPLLKGREKNLVSDGRTFDCRSPGVRSSKIYHLEGGEQDGRKRIRPAPSGRQQARRGQEERSFR